MDRIIHSNTIINRLKLETTKMPINHKVDELTYNGISHSSENKMTHDNMIESNEHNFALGKLGAKSHTVLFFIYIKFKKWQSQALVLRVSIMLTYREKGRDSV